jgi:hypothetical protein
MMRFKLPILSLLLLVFLAATALCINWGDPSLDADEMISSGEEIVVHSPEITPWASREQQKNKSSLDWTMPSTLTGTGESPKDARTLSESSGETENATQSAETGSSQSNANTSDSQQPAGMSGDVNVQGNWFFTLNDSVIRELALSLFQNEEDIYGTGKIKEGNNSVDVAVSGTIAGLKMTTKLVSTNPIVLYKLNLTVDRDWAAGEYQASASGESWTGTAEGQKTS